MSRFASLLLLIITFLMVCSQKPAEAKEALNFFKDIEAEETREDLSFRLHFNRKIVSSIQPVFYKKSIQLDLPGTGIKGKKILPVRNEMLKELKIYAYKPGVVRVRLVLAKEGLNLKKGLTITKSGNTLSIDINRKKAGFIIAQSTTVKNETDRQILVALAEASGELTKKNISKTPIPETVLSVESPSPDQETAEAVQEATEDTEGTESLFRLNSQNQLSLIKDNTGTMFPGLIKMGGALALILAMIFLASGGAKKILSGNKMFQNKNKLIQVIGSGAIGLKKNIVLVDVAGEILVLGVTNDNVTMLTKLEGQESIKQVRGHLDDNIPGTITSSFKKMWTKNSPQASEFSKELDESQKRAPRANKDDLIEDLAKNIRDRADLLKVKAKG